MKHAAPMESLNMDTVHPLYLLDGQIERLQEEHALLQEGLREIYQLAGTVRTDLDERTMNVLLRRLRDRTLAFMEEMEAHAQWEEKELFPLAAWYFGDEKDQFTLMEQEHELAEQYIRAFLHAIDRAVIPVNATEAKIMTSYLFQAYVVLQNHFRDEEEIIVALADRSNTYGY